MDKLWAPWRMQYVSAIDKKKEGCIFCVLPKEQNDSENLILFRSAYAFVIMNRFPYNNGHLMVIPNQHTAELSGLSNDEKLDIYNTIQKSVEALKKVYHPDGFNIGMNLGRVAGAGIDQHLHMHVVPRWNGDTNFMSILSDTKVISESLEQGYKKLYKVFHGQP